MRLHISIKTAAGRSLVQHRQPGLEDQAIRYIEKLIRDDVAKSPDAKRFVSADVIVEIDLFVDINKGAK